MLEERLQPGDILVDGGDVKLMLSVPESFLHISVARRSPLQFIAQTLNDMNILGKKDIYPAQTTYYSRRIRWGRWCE